jgi:hypothetical protein
MNVESVDPNLDINPADSHFLSSGGLSDATATYLSAAIITLGMIWLIWKNRKNLA